MNVLRRFLGENINKNTINPSNYHNKRMSKRQKSTNQEMTSPKQMKVENVDLSKYKLRKPKQMSINQPNQECQDQPVDEHRTKDKREHVTIEYDDKSEPTGPRDWRVIYENLKKMRGKNDAPVDSMGCQKCHDTEAEPKVSRYQTLLSLMLSSQTKDQVTHAAMLRLRQHGCRVDAILDMPEEELAELLKPVCFYKTKAKNIKKATQILKDEYDGDIPKTIEDLCKLPGVGPKMGHLTMEIAWGEITGIAVDVHVHRITNRLGWVRTKTPEETRKQLESWLPREHWAEINYLLVGFGQTVCKPVKPNCQQCQNEKLCPFAKKN